MGCEKAVAAFPGTPAIALPRSECARYRWLSVTTAPSCVDLAQLISLGTDQLAQIFVDERHEVGREFVCGASAEAR